MKDLIGFFDSGVGGISVLQTAIQLLPYESFIYLGDNENTPYGTKSLSEIRNLSEHCISVLLERGVKSIVIACNTATSAYAEILRKKVDIPVIGMEPAIKPAQLARHGGLVLALATQATLHLPKFHKLMSVYGTNVIPVIGEGFVEVVEQGLANSVQAENTVRSVLSPYMGKPVDSIVLGCTHYPFLLHHIRKLFPESDIFDGRIGTIQQLERLLASRNMLTHSSVHGSVELLTTGSAQSMELMRRLLKTPC